MNPDGTNMIKLTNTIEGENYLPKWSPDGTKILFGSNRYGKSGDFYVMNVDGTNQTDISNHNIYTTKWSAIYVVGTRQEMGASWSADGSKILFSSNNTVGSGGGGWTLYTIGVEY